MVEKNMDNSMIFKSISCLSRFGIKIDNIPKVVILGQQNEGKSSLIESITQVEILPKCEGLCTKKPIEITLINNKELKIIIKEKIYTNEKEAAEEISLMNKNDKIKEINCTILSPNVYNSTIIDTVGLIHVSEEDDTLDPKKIKKDTIEYLKDKNNIIVLVSSAPSDLANSQLLQLIKKHNRINDTLGIMTKMDLIEKQNQSNINDILCDKVYKLGYGWIATKLRSDVDIDNGITLEKSLLNEYEYFQQKVIGNYIFGVNEIRKTISNIQMKKIKKSIPSIIDEININIKSLNGSKNFLQKIIDENDGSLAKRLSFMIEKLVESSHERSQFENALKTALKSFLLKYMDKVFNYEKKQKYYLHDNISENIVDSNLYNFHVNNKTIVSDIILNDEIHDMLNGGLISSLTLNNDHLQKAFEKEAIIASLIPMFELIVDDPLNYKKIAWHKYLEKYFSSLQYCNILPDKVYEITEDMLLEYINSSNDDELSYHFTKYIIHNIGKTAFEEKMRYSITSLVNIEQRPYVSIYDVIKHLLTETDTSYLDFTQFYSFRRLFSYPNSNKIQLYLYSDLWNRIYLMTVIDRLALNCYRIVAVNLVNKMVENLLSMVINLNKDSSKAETFKIIEQLKILKETKHTLLHLQS